MSTKGFVVAFISLVLVVIALNSIYVVTELERAVLLEFGEVVISDVKPGLHVKKPFINSVIKFDARVLTVDAAAERFLTLEKKAVMVDSFAKYRVTDPALYYTSTSGNEATARSRLGDQINSGLRNEISERSLHEVVSGERDELMTVLTRRLDEQARNQFGIEIIDVRVKRIDLPVEVSQSVYNRMNTERDIEAREHRAQGQELAAGVAADADKQSEIILAQAYSQAEMIRGDGDAAAAAIYASAFNQDKEFFRFYRSMAAYKRTFSSKSDIFIVNPNSDFFQYLNKSKN